MMTKIVEAFSKKSKQDKIDWLLQNYLNNNNVHAQTLGQYWHPDAQLQTLHDEFSENTLTNFYMPFGLAPNFLIDGQIYAIPMCIEESSVVAAASKSAKFWLNKGGFKTQIINYKKLGHTHFIFEAPAQQLKAFFDEKLKPLLFELRTKNVWLSDSLIENALKLANEK